ncbi:MAG: DUF4838 domain-containing protein [Tannerella sp.]|nr:DUF4838 domain-containing protein [Tannerella sp.]
MKSIKYFLSALICCTFISCVGEPCYKMRGIVLFESELTSVDWPKLAYENGINTIGVGISPGGVINFMQSEKGKQFFADCRKYGIDVEYQIHAMNELLPRNLFAEDSTLFRMDKTGHRVSHSNLCVHSEKALDIVAGNALEFARRQPSTNHRYYFWIDDTEPMCLCPHCIGYSASEQALIIENRMVKALRTIDPEAQVAHLAYLNTLSAPRKVKPEEGVFLEYAPIERSWAHPLSNAQASNPKPYGTKHRQIPHQEVMQTLKDNLAVFPAETAVILEYWLDVSLFSRWREPHVKLAWDKAIFDSDLDTYAELGIRNVTSFGVYIDGQYIKEHNDLRFLKEYGMGMKNYKRK